MFSKPRIMSIILLLAILVISLMFSSYENFVDSANTDAVPVVNNEAPNVTASTQGLTPGLTPNAIVLGGGKSSDKLLTVSDITSTLQSDPSVQQMLTKLPVK